MVIHATATFELAPCYLDKYIKWNQDIQERENQTCFLLRSEIPYLQESLRKIPLVFHRKVISDFLMLFEYMVQHRYDSFSIYFLNELVRLRIEDTNRVLQDKPMGFKVPSSKIQIDVQNLYLKYCPSLHGNHSFVEGKRQTEYIYKQRSFHAIISLSHGMTLLVSLL